MNNEDSLELDAPTEESRAQPKLKPTRKGHTRKSGHKTPSIGRQYIPSDTLQLENDLDSFRESTLKKIAKSFRLDHGPSLPRSHATIDSFLTILCFATVHFVYLGSLDLTSQRTIALFGSIAFMVLSLSASGIYSGKRLRNLTSELKILLVCWICSFAAVGLFAFLTKTAEDVSRAWITISMASSLITLVGVRLVGCLGFIAENKTRSRNVIICGDAPSIKPLMQSLYKFSNSRVRVAKIFEFTTWQTEDTRNSLSLQNSNDQVIEFVEDRRRTGDAIEQVWIALPVDQSHIVEELSRMLINSSVDVCVAPDPYTKRILDGEATSFGDTKVVNISEISLSPTADRFKRVFDVILASAALLILFVPMVVIAALIKVESPGPSVFRQKRYGIDGREIDVLKFRSMKLHSDSLVRQATKNDARVTRIGKILRSTSLDELPQLTNVLRGNMSLVGPRPHAVAHNEIWRNQIQGYMLRHKVRPGITGWAQVNGWRGETDTAFKMQQRVKFDLEYIQNWTPWLDIKIMFFTIVKGFYNKNAY